MKDIRTSMQEARFLGVCQHTLDRWLAFGFHGFPAGIRIGHKWFVDHFKVLGYLAKRKAQLKTHSLKAKLARPIDE